MEKKGKVYEKHGNSIRNPWENHQQNIGNQRKIIGKPKENYGKTWNKHMKPLGKQLGNHRKSIGKASVIEWKSKRKPLENHKLNIVKA